MSALDADARPGKPTPIPTEVSRPLWDACTRHQLIGQRCSVCERSTFLPNDRCAQCDADALEDVDALEWVEVSGRGQVCSYTVVWRAPLPGFSDDVPYVPAVVRLDEGYNLLTYIAGSAPDDVF